MKIKICPECGKHNSENSWYCTDCGTTLSVKTLFDAADIQLVDGQIPDKLALSEISPFFHEDMNALLDTLRQSDETIIHGCDITHISRKPPFKFGYLILTSRQLICVSFESDFYDDHKVDAGLLRKNPLAFLAREVLEVKELPARNYIEVGTLGIAVDYLKQALTLNEELSREVRYYSINDITSAKLRVLDGLFCLTITLKQDDEMTVAFGMPHQARKIYKSLNTLKGKQQSTRTAIG